MQQCDKLVARAAQQARYATRERRAEKAHAQSEIKREWERSGEEGPPRLSRGLLQRLLLVARLGVDDRNPGVRGELGGISIVEVWMRPPEVFVRAPSKRLEGFLARHAYSGRRSVEGLLERLRSAPQAVIGELEADARRAAVLGLVAALEPIVSQISELTSQIRGAIRAHPDGPIFLAVFRDPNSVVCAAGLLCEIGDNRARYPHRDALAADGGQAPVAIESGKRRSAAFRWACDKRLRNHLAVLADSSRHHHPWANDIYQRARDRGCDHPHACRILGRAWTRILWRCWQDRVPYDPTKHRAATRHIQQGG